MEKGALNAPFFCLFNDYRFQLEVGYIVFRNNFLIVFASIAGSNTVGIIDVLIIVVVFFVRVDHRTDTAILPAGSNRRSIRSKRDQLERIWIERTVTVSLAHLVRARIIILYSR